MYLYTLLAQEVGGGMQHVCGVGGVVVRVAGMVISLDDLEPRAQCCLRTVQELTHPKSREDLQPQIRQRPDGGTIQTL